MIRPKYGQPLQWKTLSIHLGHVWRNLKWSAMCCISLFWLYQPKPRLRAPQLQPVSGGFFGRHLGVWGRKEVNPPPQRPSTISGGYIQNILRGWGCLLVLYLPSLHHNGLL